eukprot:CCRYP_019522-RA/>CCRYP_019522-RA protein AED:0.43 eAED:0.43 QI:0/0/0/1/0/0/2/0/364
MVRPEYMQLKLSDIPDHIIKLYKLDKLVTTDGYVYVLIQKGMYGLPQAGIIAQQLLKKRLALKGYRQSSITPGFWKHDWRSISFTLCVDDFGVKYVGIKHAHHLLQTLNKHYKTSQDWKGERYLGLTIAWDYIIQQVQLSMPGYCKKAGHCFHHPVPIKPQHQPYPHTHCTYGAKQQFVDTADDSALLSNTDKTFIQEVIGVFLYYARAVDCTMPLIEQSIRYLHAAAAFPTKSTWLAAIRKGNYSTWPLITVKNVHKYFPQSEETQQGHMRNQRQGTRSTKQALPQAEPCTPLPQLHDIFIRTYDTHSTLYTDQTGKFPHLSSKGNRYQMILYHVDSNSIWAEPTKNKTEGELILARNRAFSA